MTLEERHSHWLLVVAPMVTALGLFVSATKPVEAMRPRPAFTPLPLGTFSLGPVVNCEDLNDPTSPLEGEGVVCRSFNVSGCAGALTLGGHVEIAPQLSGQLKGTITFFRGGPGSPFYGNAAGVEYVNHLRQNGYRSIRIRWNENWADGDAEGESLRHAGCRPATVIDWVKDTYGAPTCAVGISGGASQIAVSLAHYDAETMLTFAQLETGPPHAKIDEGCDPWHSPGNAPMAACPETNFPPGLFIYGVPYDFSLETYIPPSPPPTPNVNDPTFAKMDDYHNISGPECGQENVSGEALSIFGRGSIMSTSANGWDNDYDIPVDMYICSNGINAANAGGLWFADEQASGSGLTVKCYGDGSQTKFPDPELGESWCYSEFIKGDEDALDDMKARMLACCAASPGPGC